MNLTPHPQDVEIKYGKETFLNPRDYKDFLDNFLPGVMQISFGVFPPVNQPWKYEPLFKNNALGNIFMWQIGYYNGFMYILNGHAGKPKTNDREIRTNESGRNLYQQSQVEINRKYSKKLHQGYRPYGSNEIPQITGMKGNPYKLGIVKDWPVLAGVKLDGLRLLATLRMEGIVCRSYGNKIFHNLHAIKSQLEILARYLPGTVVDGELYLHGKTLHEINSLIRTVGSKGVSYCHPELNRVPYYIFDTYYEENPSTEHRYSRLVNALRRVKADGYNLPNIRIVPMWYVHSHEQLIRDKDYCVSQGYEGLVIRFPGLNHPYGSKKWQKTIYQFRRCCNMLKVKDFKDEEGIVVGVERCEGSESQMCKLIIEDKHKIRIPIRFGTEDERRLWLINPGIVLRRQFTFKYTSRHPQTNIPQQPTGVSFRDFD